MSSNPPTEPVTLRRPSRAVGETIQRGDVIEVAGPDGQIIEEASGWLGITLTADRIRDYDVLAVYPAQSCLLDLT